MSPKSATGVIGIGFAVAATAALAQLGLAYGFGLLAWVDADLGAPALDHRWNANLAWVAWFSAASCVVGGLASGAVGSRDSNAGSRAVRVGAVLASAIGAFAVGPLVALSAEQNAAFTSFPTEPLVAAGVGAAVGLVLALIGLSSRSVAANVGASIALVWLLAVLATFADVGDAAGDATELAVWGSWASPESALGRRGFSIAVPFVVGSALIGVVVAALARRGPITNSGYRIAAASGIAGPLIVTVAHLADPSLAGGDSETMAVMLVGPYAAIAGLLGSLIVSAIPRAGGQVDDTSAENERTEPAATAPGWTIPEAPGSAYSDATPGDTKDLPGAPAETEPSDPDVDWVQELKPVDGGSLAAHTETQTETEAGPKPKAEPKPKRAKKTVKQRRRKTADADTEAEAGPQEP